VSRKRIAPTLRLLLLGEGILTSDWLQAQRELRALLAVARAARRWNEGHPNGELHSKLDAALAQLDKVSAKGDP